jgi:hypothetical protein
LRLEAPPDLVRVAVIAVLPAGPVSVAVAGTVPVYARFAVPVTVKVGTLPVDPATISVGVLGDESTPVELMLTVPGAALAAICPKFKVVAVPFTELVIEIGATTVASALVVTDAVGPAANAAEEETRPSTAAETRSLFIDLPLFSIHVPPTLSPLDSVIARK